MEGGEKENRGKVMPKKKRSFLERALEAITGAFIIYLSSSATNDIVKGFVIVFGIIILLYSVIPD
jgi:hypothetical protein